MAEGGPRVRECVSKVRNRHGYWIVSRSPSPSHDDPGTPELYYVARLQRSIGNRLRGPRTEVRKGARECEPALPENGADRSRSGAVCRPPGTSRAFPAMAEFPPTVLGNRTENSFSGTSGLPVYRAGEVSAGQREIPPNCLVHARRYE